MEDYEIVRLENSKLHTASEILEVQLPSYRIEAELIGFYGIPALHDTVETIMESDEIFWGCYIEGRLAGFVSFKVEESLLDIHRMVVHPDFFRRGIAKELLRYIEGLYEYVDRITVSTGAGNLPAKRLYIENGYRELGEVEVEKGVFISCFEKRI